MHNTEYRIIIPYYFNLQVCDWVACLRPPIPPPNTNLIITGWFGAPVPFNGIATYVCARGMQFENDPYQENVTYTCQVTIGCYLCQSILPIKSLFLSIVIKMDK